MSESDLTTTSAETTFQDAPEETTTFAVQNEQASSVFSFRQEDSNCRLTHPVATVGRSPSRGANHNPESVASCGQTAKGLAAVAALAQVLIILVTLLVVHKYGLLPDNPEPRDLQGFVSKGDVDAAPSGNLADDYGALSSLLDSVPPISTGSSSTDSLLGNISRRTLVCMFADTFEGDFPAHLCSYLIFMDAVLDLDTRTIRPHSAEQGRPVLQRFIGQSRELHPHTGSKFLVSLWEARVQDTYQELFRDWSRATRVATLAQTWLRRAGLDGLALLNLPLGASNAYDLLGIFKVLRAVFGGDFVLVFGFHGATRSKMDSHTEKALRDIARISNLTFLETHDARPYSCRVFLPNAYRTLPEDELNFSLARELSWSTGTVRLYPLREHRLCISLSLAAFRFVLHASTPPGPGSRCYSYYAASFRQHCTDVHLNESTYDEVAMSMWWKVPVGGSLRASRLEAFDTAETLRRKLSLILDEYPQLCVALYHADLEDYRGNCDAQGEPFARISAIRQLLDARGP